MTAQHEITKIRLGIGKSFGTFGELLQGVSLDNADFLVTLPIARYTIAKFAVDASIDHLCVVPSGKQKSRNLAELLLEMYKLPCKGMLTLESDIPIGKGLASSSADMVATARAISNYYSLNLSTERLQDFMRQIEPTDGVMYGGVVSFYHRKVQLRQFLGYLPHLSIIGKDEGGQVDTIEFNKIVKPFTLEEKIEYEFLLDKISQAIQKQDLRAIGEVSTRSAMMNQKLRKKKYFEWMLDICSSVNALGLVVAHSGTYIGLLLDPALSDFQNQKEQALASLTKMPGEVTVYETWVPIRERSKDSMSSVV